MHFLSAITENLYLTIFAFCLIMLATETMYGRSGMHYSKNIISDLNMRQHPLNAKYRLYQRSDVDDGAINRKISACHCIVIVISCLIMCLNIIAGLFVLLIGNGTATYLLIEHIGKSYTDR